MIEDSTKVYTGRAVAAGFAGGTAYLASVWADNRLSSQHFDDLKLVGQVFTTRSPAWILQGLAAHFGFSVVVALLYAAWGARRLPGPSWMRGVLFLQLENAVLYPGAGLLMPVHAGVKSGQVPSLFERKVIQGQLVRHIAFGLVLGWMYGRRWTMDDLSGGWGVVVDTI
ncbi:MAG: hypothetical protein ACJ78Q_18775 [Chloroflexia bacterium]